MHRGVAFDVAALFLHGSGAYGKHMPRFSPKRIPVR